MVGEIRNDIFRGKAGRHNAIVIRSLISGEKTAYDVHADNRDYLEYSISNRRLRALEEDGYVTRISDSSRHVSTHRIKIYYALTLQGSIAALLVEPILSEKEFLLLLDNYRMTNPSYGLLSDLLKLGMSAELIWDTFAVKIRNAVNSGLINLEAPPEIMNVFLALELMKSVERPIKDNPMRRKQITEAVYDFLRNCPFEKFFGNMTVVIAGAIVQRYLEKSKAYKRMFRRINGNIRYTFSPLPDAKAIEVLPFLDTSYSRIANDCMEALGNMSSFIYAMYDEYGES